MTTSRLIMITFLVVVITTSYVVIGDGNNVVYSADAGPVLPNVPYYISFMSYDYNMWICRMNATTSDPKTCPHQPVMFTRPTITPTPVMFILPSSTPDTVIRESTKLSIKFVNPRKCHQSGVWRVANGEVVLGGVVSKEDSLFSIHMTDSYYKFTIGESIYPDVDTTQSPPSPPASTPPAATPPPDNASSPPPPATSISISNTGNKDRLIAKQLSGEMEVLFYKNYPPETEY